MNDRHLQAELSHCELFNALELADRERLQKLFRNRSFQQHEEIFLKGDPGHGMYLIQRGKIKVCVIDRYGTELVFTFLGAGDLLGEMAILDGKPRSATAIAMEDTTTAFLDRRDFLDFLGTNPQACINIINLLCARLRRLSNQLEEISFLEVSGRIARNLLALVSRRSPDYLSQKQSLTCQISQEELATVVGASRVMINKVLNSFVDAGIVAIARKQVTVLKEAELERIGSYNSEE